MLVGIDLGTTNSLVACFKDGKTELIKNRLGKNMTPSVVSVDDDGNVLVGETAKEYGMLHPLNVAKTFKRTMGTEKEYILGNKKFSSEELSSIVLKSLKEDAESYLGEEVTDAIISVPAYFNEHQRKATKRAGELAGLNVQRIINEPTAAAISYGVGDNDKEEKCLVFDLGGGTFDVSILEFTGCIMEVHAVAGDNHLGGEDFTNILADMFLTKAAIAPESLDIRTMNKVIKAAENAKCRFVNESEVDIVVTINDAQVEQKITLREYEKACEELLESIKRPIERSLKDARIGLKDLDRVILVGGATRLPIIKSFVAKLFKMVPGQAVDPDTSVAVGAALQCAMKERNKEIEEVVLTDVCPFTLGTEVIEFNGYFDEGGHYLPIIERNTVIPVSRTQSVYTAHDNQERVEVKVLQGESRLASNNLELGKISVPVPKGPKGTEEVSITYTYDVNSLLEVEILVVSTGVTRKVVIQGSDKKLDEEEVAERLKKLQYLKRSPREDEENKLILLRAERIYEESSLEEKAFVDRLIMNFEHILDGQDKTAIEKARKEMAKRLDEIEFELDE